MSVRFSEITANEYLHQLEYWKLQPDYREDKVRGVVLTVTKHWSDGKLVGRIMNNRAERRSRYMVRLR